MTDINDKDFGQNTITLRNNRVATSIIPRTNAELDRQVIVDTDVLVEGSTYAKFLEISKSCTRNRRILPDTFRRIPTDREDMLPAGFRGPVRQFPHSRSCCSCGTFPFLQRTIRPKGDPQVPPGSRCTGGIPEAAYSWLRTSHVPGLLRRFPRIWRRSEDSDNPPGSIRGYSCILKEVPKGSEAWVKLVFSYETVPFR